MHGGLHRDGRFRHQLHMGEFHPCFLRLLCDTHRPTADHLFYLAHQGTAGKLSVRHSGVHRHLRIRTAQPDRRFRQHGRAAKATGTEKCLLPRNRRLPGAFCHSSGTFPAMDRQLHHLLRALPRPAQRDIPQREIRCHADAAALGRAHTGGAVRHPVRLRLLRTQPLQVLPSLSGGRADGHLPHFSGAVAVLRKVPEKRSVSCTFSKKGAGERPHVPRGALLPLSGRKRMPRPHLCRQRAVHLHLPGRHLAAGTDHRHTEKPEAGRTAQSH